MQFAKRMGYRKIGIANCISFIDHAYVLSGILESHGIEVVSVACKTGNIPPLAHTPRRKRISALRLKVMP